jgi:hypothetical protein
LGVCGSGWGEEACEENFGDEAGVGGSEDQDGV